LEAGVERLRDKVAVISGAAGSIGAATARLFVAEGARVVVTDVNGEALEHVASELGDAAAPCVADVTDSAQVRAAVALAVERFGGLDVAFANAGVFGAIAPVAEYPEDVFDQVMAVNVRGTFLLAATRSPPCATAAA
jgi:NAD(P)-dependent dehydrogenase (short-subunit alcohol dehydrogenase family)